MRTLWRRGKQKENVLRERRPDCVQAHSILFPLRCSVSVPQIQNSRTLSALPEVSESSALFPCYQKAEDLFYYLCVPPHSLWLSKKTLFHFHTSQTHGLCIYIMLACDRRWRRVGHLEFGCKEIKAAAATASLPFSFYRADKEGKRTTIAMGYRPSVLPWLALTVRR